MADFCHYFDEQIISSFDVRLVRKSMSSIGESTNHYGCQIQNAIGYNISFL